MEGRILRRQADPKAQLRGAGSWRASRRSGGCCAGRPQSRAAALLLGVLMLVATAVARVGVSAGQGLELQVGRQEPSATCRPSTRATPSSA